MTIFHHWARKTLHLFCVGVPASLHTGSPVVRAHRWTTSVQSSYLAVSMQTFFHRKQSALNQN